MGHEIPQIDAMRMGVDYSFMVALRQFKVSLRPLTGLEVTNAWGAVADHLQTVPQHRRTKMLEDYWLSREILKTASSPFGPKTVPSITDPLLDAMTQDEVIALFKEWNATCDRVNPQLEIMPIEQLKDLVEEVKKNPPSDTAYQLTQLSFGQLVSLATYLLTKGD